MNTNQQTTQEAVHQQRKTWKKPELRKLCLTQAAGCGNPDSSESESSSSKLSS
jgi:hypothetical protein